ncbi:hypothetical protein DLJ96_07645 [Actinotalea fermentans ATCC 43279 = JCM 9966 = DSM 3133]|nr:hypothetical protein DLJ96_07645 [Actinotalea fermentans ATCC 43279 = JCM 9966 = DSM 3133]
MWVAIVSGLVVVLSVVGLAGPMYAALRSDNGPEGACLARHSQSATGAIQDLPTDVRVDWLSATLECGWPTADGGTSRQSFELAPPSRQNALLIVFSVAVVGVVGGLASAALGARRAVART